MEGLLGEGPLAEQAALLVSPLTLALLGDAVHHLFIRTRLVLSGGKAGAIHKEATACVNAAAQARTLEAMLPLLTPVEGDVVRRGRNAHAHHGTPRRQDPADYAKATGLEALLGFLYLTGQTERLGDLLAQARTLEEDNG